MEQTKRKNEGFFRKVYNSLTNFDKYVEYCLETISKPIKYLFQISLIVSIILSSIAIYNIYKNDINFIKDNLSDFEYKDNTLSFQSTHNLEVQDRKIIIDTYTENEDEILKYKNEASLYNDSLILLKNKAIIRLKNSDFDFEYKELIPDVYFNKNMVIEYFSGINLIYLAINVYIMLTIYNFFRYLVLILLLSIFGMLLKYMLKLNLKYSHVFNICVYAYTLPIILELIFSILNMLFGFKVYRFDLMADIISYIYILAALIAIRTNIIKRQIEFAKLKMAMDKNMNENNTEKEE